MSNTEYNTSGANKGTKKMKTTNVNQKTMQTYFEPDEHMSAHSGCIPEIFIRLHAKTGGINGIPVRMGTAPAPAPRLWRKGFGNRSMETVFGSGPYMLKMLG